LRCTAATVECVIDAEIRSISRMRHLIAGLCTGAQVARLDLIGDFSTTRHLVVRNPRNRITGRRELDRAHGRQRSQLRLGRRVLRVAGTGLHIALLPVECRLDDE